MRIERFYSDDLSGASYYIESGGEVAIVDPLRDVGPYLEQAEKRQATIRYVFETHFHADFVSGHQELAEKAGAEIVLGPTAVPGYKARVAHDGQIFKLGKITIEALHTPGHSLESTCWLLRDEKGEELALFTGDTLLIDGVGRPDLVQKLRTEITPRFLAGLLFDSLRNKILPLADHVLIYPGHGAGSPCGKNISRKAFDSLGAQKISNRALNPQLNREKFIEQCLTGLEEPPLYFPFNILNNSGTGIPALNEVVEKGRKPLTPEQFHRCWKQESALVIDTRPASDFIEKSIPGALPFPLNKNFGRWMGQLITDMRQPLLLITEAGRNEELVMQLSRIGYHYIIGCLGAGMESWENEGRETRKLHTLNEAEVKTCLKKDRRYSLLDLRSPDSRKRNPLFRAIAFDFDQLQKEAARLDPRKSYMVAADDIAAAAAAAAILDRAGKTCDTLLNSDASWLAE